MRTIETLSIEALRGLWEEPLKAVEAEIMRRASLMTLEELLAPGVVSDMCAAHSDEMSIRTSLMDMMDSRFPPPEAYFMSIPPGRRRKELLVACRKWCINWCGEAPFQSRPTLFRVAEGGRADVAAGVVLCRHEKALEPTALHLWMWRGGAWRLRQQKAGDPV